MGLYSRTMLSESLCRNGTASPKVTDGRDCLWVWRTGANILRKTVADS